jgi:hypothetical protein
MRSLSGVVALVLAVFAWVSGAIGQQYRTDPVDDTAKNNGAVARLCVKDSARYVQEQAKVMDFFSKVYFPSMTRTDEKDLGNLGKLRYNLFKNYLWPATNVQLQTDLTQLAYDAMLNIALSKSDPPYHPAVRYNAILIIGMLDEQYGIETGASRRAPVPLKKANDFLTLVVDKGAEDKVPPPLMFGAIVGLERHAQYKDSWKNEAPARIEAMRKALLKLVTHEKPVQDMDRDAYSWMRMRAAQVLAMLGGVGEQNAVHNALVKLVATGRSLDDRCNVAGLLEKLDYKDVKLDDAGTAEPLFALARDVAAAEDKRAEDFQNAGGTGAVVVGPNGETLETYPRRQVLARLTGLSKGLTKVKAGLPTETQKKVDELLKAIEPAKTAAANKDTVELKLAESVRTMAAAVNRAVPSTEKASAEKKAADTL